MVARTTKARSVWRVLVHGVEIRYGDYACLLSECEVIRSGRLSELNMAGMFGLLAVVVLSPLSISL